MPPVAGTPDVATTIQGSQFLSHVVTVLKRLVIPLWPQSFPRMALPCLPTVRGCEHVITAEIEDHFPLLAAMGAMSSLPPHLLKKSG